MKGWTPIVKRALFLGLLAIFMPSVALAQLIALKTVPVATGDQFLLFPSQNLGMGGVSIALEDSLLDPFINPAKGSRIRGSHLFSSPTYYGVSEDDGTARTLPLGVLIGSRQWFGGLALAVQQLGAANRDNFRIVGPTFELLSGSSPHHLLSARWSNNMYLSGMLGKKLSGSNMAIAGSVFWAGLNAVDGVDLLYARSQEIDQFGSMLDVRAGLLGEFTGGRSFEVLLLHHRFNMTHDVTYLDWLDRIEGQSSWQTRLERHLDRSTTWGLHSGYVQPLPGEEWRIGGILTVNRKSHPKIPNYELMNIPRDPGHSWAYNLGLGFSRTHGLGTFGIDLIYEPIWSNTWATAATPVTTPSGRIIPAGGKTIENDFRFSNALLRIGIRREDQRFGFQLGMQVRSIHYRLKQYNNVEGFRREQEESWAELTPSLGLSLKFPEFQLRYMGRMTTGTGRPGVARTRSGRGLGASFDSDFIIAPSGPLTLQDAHLITHQISVSIPLGY